MKNNQGNLVSGGSGPLTRRDDLVFRVFLSSTFQDFKEERNALQEFVWPALEAFCRKHEALFHAIDLRWGISVETSLDQQTMNICIDELRRCQELSPRPNFVILLGNRYGWCPLPARVPADEFHELLEKSGASYKREDRAFLLWDNPLSPPPIGMGWYALDRNAGYCAPELHASPGEYILRGRRPGTPEAEPGTWNAIQERLRGLLLDAAQRAGWAEDDPRRRKYVLSATHQEIEQGACRTANPDRHVFAYLRDILDLPQAALDSGLVDRDQTRINELRSVLTDLIPENKRLYEMQWVGGTTTLAYIGNAKSLSRDSEEAMPWHTRCSPYLSRLCSDVYHDLKAVIDREIADFDAQPHPTRESDVHTRHAQDVGDLLIGRDAELARLSCYLDSDSTQPMLVFGPYGIGKTALLARAWFSRSGNAKSLFRSIGVTPRSTDLHQLLFDIARELAPGSEALAEEEACGSFMTALAQAGSNHKVILWIDGLDLLTSQHEAHFFAWFPTSLPGNIKLVASANPDAEQVHAGLTALRNRMPPEQVLDLGPLPQDAGPRLMHALLCREGRTLQPVQAQAVLQSFDNCLRPIALRLGCHLARRWHSWDAPVLAERNLASFQSVTDLLEGILHWAGQKHGESLVSRAFGSIALSCEGLAENELLSLLSKDSRFLSEVMTLYPDSPSVQKLPPVIWYRLFRDVEFLFAMRQVDNTRTLSFAHKIIADAVRAQVLTPGVGERTCRLGLADYFETESAGVRQADELPRQLASLGEWQRLQRVLLKVPLSELVWRRHGNELVQHWSHIRQHCRTDIALACRDSWREALDRGTVPTSVSVVLGNLGYAAAAEEITDAIIRQLRQNSENSAELAGALCGKAIFLEARHDHPGAQSLLNEALAIYRGLNNRRAVASCLSTLAGAIWQESPREALSLLAEAEAVLREICSPDGLAACLGNQANIHASLGNVADALRLQREALRICRELNLTIQTAEHAASLGMMLSHAGEAAEALSHLEVAEGAFRDFHLGGPLGACLGQMANIHARQGSLRRAFELNEEALDLMQGSGQHVWLTTCLVNQAGLCLELGEFSIGRQRAEEALQKIKNCAAPMQLRQKCLQVLFELKRRK